MLGVDSLEPVKFTDEEWNDFVKHASQEHIGDIIRVRTNLQRGITNTLYEKGFLHPPTYLFSTCTDPLAHETEEPSFKYYGQNLSSVQSLIFHKMAILGLCKIDKVFWISPNIRKELNVKDKKRYSTEFTQIDWEIADGTMEHGLSVIDTVVRTIFFKGNLNRYDAVEYAEKEKIGLTEVEAHLSAREEKPFIITNLKREAYDKRDDKTGKYLNFDLCMPGFGEVLSGGEREYEYDRLVMRMNELGYNLEYFEPILRLAREKKLRPSVGGGFGLERLTRAVCGCEDIADVYPFKRTPEEKILF